MKKRISKMRKSFIQSKKNPHKLRKWSKMIEGVVPVDLDFEAGFQGDTVPMVSYKMDF